VSLGVAAASAELIAVVEPHPGKVEHWATPGRELDLLVSLGETVVVQVSLEATLVVLEAVEVVVVLLVLGQGPNFGLPETNNQNCFAVNCQIFDLIDFC